MNSFLILAGGASSRMGKAKGLVAFQDRTWLEWQLQRINEYQQNPDFKINELFIVLGHHIKEYLSLLISLKSTTHSEGGTFESRYDINKNMNKNKNGEPNIYFCKCNYSEIQKYNCKIINNPKPELGPFSSLKCGLQLIAPESSGVFVLPIDVPAPSISVINQILAASVNAQVVIPTIQYNDHSKGGHPVWLAKSVVRQILQMEVDQPESRLDLIIKSLPAEDVARISVTDNYVIRNLNTPIDFAEFARLESEDETGTTPI